MEKKENWRYRLLKLPIYIDVDCGEHELGFAIGNNGFEELEEIILEELDKAREEGRLSVIQELLFEPEEPSHNISTLEAAFKYEDIIKKYSEEWRNKTKLISPKYIKSKLKQ